MSIRTNFYPDGTTINTAADFIAPWAAMLSDGVFGATDFAASADSPADLAVSVAIGRAIKDGHFIHSDAAEKVPISANTSGYNRIDVIVLQVDDTVNLTSLAVVQGTPSSSPTAPILQDNHLPLAQVMVGNNVSVIDSSAITDVRTHAAINPYATQDLRDLLPVVVIQQVQFSNAFLWFDASNCPAAAKYLDGTYDIINIYNPSDENSSGIKGGHNVIGYRVQDDRKHGVFVIDGDLNNNVMDIAFVFMKHR